MSLGRARKAQSLKRVDIYTHFLPLRFLDFVEKHEGGLSSISALYRSKPRLIDPKARIELLDANQIDIHVLVPVPWLDGFPRVAKDPTLAATAARLMNDELAAVVATQPKRFRGVAALPTVDMDATVA
jgi:predicted TIM-barrel fold metal-dependent hydrolase